MIRLWLGIGALILSLLGVATPLQGAEYRYSYIPKHVYTTQVFPVTILASDADPRQPVMFRFDPNSGQMPLNAAPVKGINGHDLFYTFYFQAGDVMNITIPPLTIRENNQTHSLPQQKILVETLSIDGHPEFCGLIASDCTLQSSQVSMFDANTSLVTITLRTHEGNPEAIHIPSALEEGIEKIQRKQTIVTAEYYFVIPSNQKSLTVSYYNTVQHRFIPKTIATDYHNKPVAAQVELNPKLSHFDRLKKYGSVVLALFFFAMLLWQRGWFYLILLIFTLAVTIMIFQPRSRVCVQEGSPLYILPAPNSRVSTTVTETLTTPSLGTHGKYTKINYRHSTIGWIRHEDRCQD